MINSPYWQRAITYAAPLCLLLYVPVAHSADIAYEIRQGSDASVTFELGFQANLADIPIVGLVKDDPEDPTGGRISIGLMFEGRAEWKGLFAETNSNSFSNFALGYSLWSNDNASVDLVLSDGLGPYDPSIGAFESVDNRSSDLVAGVRSTHHLDNTLVQFEIYNDVSGKHDGQMAALQVGKFRQVKNWNIHGLVGVRYFSESMLDYYFGISEQESTADIPRYEATGGTLATLEIGATLPLTDRWIFRSTMEGIYLPDSVSDSPLSDGRLGVIASTSVSYVF